MYKLKFLGIIFLLILFVSCKENSSATKDKNTSHIKTENTNTGQNEISVKNNSNTGSIKDLIKERNQVNAKISEFQSENTREKSLRIKEIRKEIKALNQSSGINDLLSKRKIMQQNISNNPSNKSQLIQDRVALNKQILELEKSSGLKDLINERNDLNKQLLNPELDALIAKRNDLNKAIIKRK